MHGTSPSVDGHCDLPLATPPMARYCANCDIQFASYKNYQVHKEYYCNTRHVHKSIASSSSPNVSVQPQQNPQQLTSSSHSSQPRSPENASSQSDTNAKGYNSMVLNQPLYAAISTSPLILVPCSYVAGGGLSPAAGLIPAGNIIIPNPSSSPDANSDAPGPNVIPTYTVMPGSATDLNTVPSPSAAEDGTKDDAKLPKTPKDKEPKLEPPKSPKERSKEDTEKPLDLSFRKRDGDAKPSVGKVATDSVVPSTTLTSTSSSASPSSEENSVPMTPAPALPILPLINPAMDLNIISRAQLQGLDPAAPTLPPVLAPPQMLVKQGTSKCKECNIVFYKHENYLVHKNQYCAARGPKRDSGSPERVKNDESDSMDREETATRSSQKSPISSPRLNNLRTPPAPESNDPSEASSNPTHVPPVFQYYCVACGIKYTSIDNLRAHQLYYCPKRDMNSTQTLALVPSFPRNTHEFKCSKCKNAYPTEDLLKQHPCVVQRKCPYCDVYCPTLSAAQRHLVTHTGIKSFKCSLCGYKGHTLRGMRTHIRIHLDKNSSTPEEAYILCMDEGGAEIGCASRKSSGVRVNSDRIKSVISTEPPHGEIAMAVSPISGPSPNVVPSDIVAIKAVPDDPVATGDTTHWCQICGYSSSYKGNVVRHVKLVHKDLISTQTMSNIVNSRPSVDNAIKPNEPLEHPSRGTPQESLLSAADHSNSSSSMDVKPMINGIVSKTEQHLRLEDKPLMLKTEAVSPPPPSGGGNTSKGIKRPLPEDGQCPTGAFKTGPKYCKSCDISFNYLSNFLAHKKFYCTPRPGEVSNQESTSVQSVQ
ncbi:Zinc finger protein ush, partial [Stegodyphus mimosarum]